MNVKCYDFGQIVFKQGAESDCMYDILKGNLGVYDAYGTNDEKLIARLTVGQTVGEMGMIEVFPRSATVVALEDGTELAEITEDELSEYFRDKPEKLLAIMKQLSQRLRETTQKYADACRVVYETEETDRTGGERSSWLQDCSDKIIQYYSGVMY